LGPEVGLDGTAKVLSREGEDLQTAREIFREMSSQGFPCQTWLGRQTSMFGVIPSGENGKGRATVKYDEGRCGSSQSEKA